LCTFGAIRTALTLAIEPFTPQISRPAICSRRQLGMIAKVAHANNCTELGYGTDLGTSALESGMSATMYAGLLNIS
jgi:hypothetical protein